MEKRIWFITGISSGLGKALADEVMASGDFVIGTFRQASQVAQFNETHRGQGASFQLDITQHLETADVVQEIITRYGRIDILVNNAGVGFIGAVEEASMNEIRNVFEANVFGTLHLTQQVLPHMRKERNGHIIQISSHGGIKSFAGFGIYNASKFALEGFSEALAQEVEPLGIKVSLVEPGPFRTGFAGSALGEAQDRHADYDQTAGVFREKLKSVHGKQEGDPQKAAQAIFALANEPNPSLRLPLGPTALKTIGMKLASVKADLERHQHTAENAVFK